MERWGADPVVKKPLLTLVQTCHLCVSWSGLLDGRTERSDAARRPCSRGARAHRRCAAVSSVCHNMPEAFPAVRNTTASPLPYNAPMYTQLQLSQKHSIFTRKQKTSAYILERPCVRQCGS